MSRNLVHHIVDEVLPAVCQEVATPRALSVAILARYGEWDQLANLALNPLHYTAPHQYWLDATVTSLLRKWQPLPTTVDRKAVALENFWKSERQCCRTNLRLQPFVENCLSSPDEEPIFRFLRKVRKNVSRILGRTPSAFSGGELHEEFEAIDASDSYKDYVQEIELGGVPDRPPQKITRLSRAFDGRFGPGATYGDKGQLTTVADKMSSSPTCTPGALGFLFDWAETKWATCVANSGGKINFIRGNRFTTVPKDCRKDRGIAVEPSINVFYQLAVGRLMKQRLKRSGLDLLNAKETHMRVAREASSRGNFATLDLSNASDSVATSLVRLLLPHGWFELLDSLRSPTTLVKGKTVRLEKFSSMGNGYTFELETLLFAAISMTVCSELGLPAKLGVDVYVFGDDIIVPTEAAPGVTAVLRYLGFDLNNEKSFVEGPFRESCGGDFFLGVDVRPYFCEDDLYEPQHYIAAANGLRRSASADPESRWPHLHRGWFRLLDQLPVSIRRLRGPTRLGDIVVHDEESRWQTEIDRSGGRETHGHVYLKAYMPDPARLKWVEWKHFRSEVVLATALRGVGDGQKGILPRDPVGGFAIRRVLLECLGNPGPAAT